MGFLGTLKMVHALVMRWAWRLCLLASKDLLDPGADQPPAGPVKELRIVIIAIVALVVTAAFISLIALIRRYRRPGAQRPEWPPRDPRS